MDPTLSQTNNNNTEASGLMLLDDLTKGIKRSMYVRKKAHSHLALAAWWADLQQFHICEMKDNCSALFLQLLVRIELDPRVSELKVGKAP